MTFSRIVSSEQKRVLCEELEGGRGLGAEAAEWNRGSGTSDYSSKAGAARVFVCPRRPARAWPQAPALHPTPTPAPAQSRAPRGEGQGIVCGQRAAAGQWGRVTWAGFLEEGDMERSWTEGRLEEENGLGLRGDPGVMRGGGRGDRP